jgi:Ca2+-binding EF-hand superfamily protein
MHLRCVVCSALYAFALYDADDSGIIDKKETEKMLKEMYGKQYHDNPQAVM